MCIGNEPRSFSSQNIMMALCVAHSTRLLMFGSSGHVTLFVFTFFNIHDWRVLTHQRSSQCLLFPHSCQDRGNHPRSVPSSAIIDSLLHMRRSRPFPRLGGKISIQPCQIEQRDAKIIIFIFPQSRQNF